mgnify:FL=1
MIKFLVLPIVMAIATSAAAQPLDLDAIAKLPGTQVVKRGDTVEFKRGGVTVTIGKDGETGVDNSGHAVLCYWNLAIVAKISADLCYPGEFPQLSAMLGQFIDAANTFITSNSLRPVTRAPAPA